MKMRIILAFAFTVMSGAAFAQNSDPKPTFKSLDLNGDGNLSMSEAQSKYPNVTQTTYMKADGNKDFKLDQDEFNSLVQAYNRAN